MKKLVLVAAIGCIACSAPLQRPKIGLGLLAAVSAATVATCPVLSTAPTDGKFACDHLKGLVALSALSLVGLIVLNVVAADMRPERTKPERTKPVPKPAPNVGQGSDAGQLAADAMADARADRCDKALALARLVFPLDKVIHAELMTSPEIKRCLPPSEPLPTPPAP